MGSIPYDGGTTFRVWAPHAEAVFVTGTFDGWAMDATPLAPDDAASDGGGTWSADVPGVGPGRPSTGSPSGPRTATSCAWIPTPAR